MNNPKGKRVRTHSEWLEICTKTKKMRDMKIKKYLSKIQEDKSDYQKFVKKLPENLGTEKLLKMGIKELREVILKRLVKPTELVQVYLERALEVGIELGAIADVNIDRALQLAKLREEYLDRFSDEEIAREIDDEDNPGGEENRKFGLLFGVPISIKETYEMDGTYATFGMAALSEQRNIKDGNMVEYLLSEGAVIFIKTNVPMFLKTIETVNRIYGRALNPWDTDRTPGGSSGGESAMISCYASPGGVGGDIGGSIRTPCAFTGIWGLKPSSRRLSYTGNGRILPNETGCRIGQKCISAVVGPLARSPDSVIRLFKTMNIPRTEFDDTLLDYKPWDGELFRSKKKLRIGYVKSMSVFPACKAQQRAVEEAVEIAKKLGHTVTEVNYNFDEFFYAYLSVISHGDKQAKLHEVLRGEKYIQKFDIFNWGEKLPTFITKLAGKFINKDSTRFNKIIDAVSQDGVGNLINAYDKVEACRQSFHRHFTKLKLDAIISPSIGVPSLLHGHAAHLFAASCYSMVYNVLDWPAGSIPITFVKEEEQFYNCDYDDKITKLSQKTMEGSKGLPIGVQIATLRHKEETILRLMKDFEPLITDINYPWNIN